MPRPVPQWSLGGRRLIERSQLLELAVVVGLIGRNPAAGVMAPTARVRDQRFLTADQVVLPAEAVGVRRHGAGLIVETPGLRRASLR